MHFRVLFAHPANRAPYPEAIETFGSLNIRSIVKGAVTRKYAIRSKNASYESECREFIREEVNCVTKESRVCFLDDMGKIGSLTLDEINFHLYPICLNLFHTPLCPVQGLCRRIDTNNMCLASLFCQFFGDKPCDSSSS